MTDRFDRNLQKWAVTSPKEALMLPFLIVEEHSVCSTRAGEDNLLIHHTPLHSMESAKNEAAEWAATLNFQKCELCYVYGIGLGYPYMALRAWLKKNKKRMIVFLEDDLGVIKRFMETEIAEKFLKDPQVRLHFHSGVDGQDQFLDALYWNFALSPILITALPSYKTMKAKQFEELSHKISFTHAHNNATVDEYVQFGIRFYYNFYVNLLRLPEAFAGNKLFGKFKGIPAMICGAGPSLGKQMEQIAKLSNRTIIFGCGSAMNALNAAGIKPHFGAAIDPNAEQLKRLENNSADGVPYFYRNRLFPKALDNVKGPRLYITGGGGYEVSDWFEDKLKIARRELEEGHNVVNFSIELAKQLGCNPIVLVGCDLAFTGMKAYADGIVNDATVTVPEITVCEEFDDQAIVHPDIFGQPTYTLWKWISEANWIGDFAKLNKKLKVFNATEGGIGFPDVPNITLEMFVEKYLKDTFDLKNRIDEQIKLSPLKGITLKKIESLLDEMFKSLQRSEQFIQTLLTENNAAIQKAKETQSLPEAPHTGAFALAEFELSEEPAFLYVLSTFNSVYTLLLTRESEEIRNHMPRTPHWKKFIKTLELNNKKFNFLLKCSLVNRKLIQEAMKQHLRKS